jgi:hypothetical protein
MNIKWVYKNGGEVKDRVAEPWITRRELPSTAWKSS